MFPTQANLTANTTTSLYNLALASVTADTAMTLKRGRFESRRHFEARVATARQGIEAARIALVNAH